MGGVSPYCTVAIDNSNCSNETQQSVTYTLDKSQYANGDTIIVKARLNTYGNSKYTLSSDTYNKFTVKNQPEFITSLQNINLTILKSELNDYISAGKAKVLTNDQFLFSLYWKDTDNTGYFSSVKSTTLKATYFSSLKAMKQSDFKLGRTCYNRVSFVYEMEYTWKNYLNNYSVESGKAWFTISAENIIRYPEGRIEWGTASIGKGDFTCDESAQGLNACINSTIMVNSDKYNISKIN